MFVVACIPAYNEEKTIAKVIVSARKYVDQVLVCDDGSTDSTTEIAEALGCVVLRHSTRRGKGSALSTLFAEAIRLGANAAVTIDADGQHDPDDIPRLLAPIRTSETDIVVGSRYVDGGGSDASAFRKAGLAVLNGIASPGGVVRDTQCGFRAFSFRALLALSRHGSTGYSVEEEHLAMAVRAGLRVKEVPIAVRYEGVETSSSDQPVLQGAGLVATALRLILEQRPLALLCLPGVILVLAGLACAGYLIYLFNVSDYFSIPVALVTLGSVLTGMVLIFFGAIMYALSRILGRS